MPTLHNLTIYHRAFIEYLAKELTPISGKELIEKIIQDKPDLKTMAEKIPLRKVVRDLRIAKMPIIEKGGYCYARTEEELNEYTKKLEGKSTPADTAMLRGLSLSFSNVGYPERLTFTLFWDLPIRKDRTTVALHQFEIDADGKPVNPDNLEILR